MLRHSRPSGDPDGTWASGRKSRIAKDRRASLDVGGGGGVAHDKKWNKCPVGNTTAGEESLEVPDATAMTLMHAANSLSALVIGNSRKTLKPP